MFKSRVWLNVVLVTVIAVLAVCPAAALAAPSTGTGAADNAISTASPSAWGLCGYRVHWGDTLADIAWQHYTSANYLRLINWIPNPNRIYAGQFLRVPCHCR